MCKSIQDHPITTPEVASSPRVVVGWGCVEGEKCGFCDNEASVYVEIQHEAYRGEMFPSCKSCTPPRTCRDKIADIFVKNFPA
jgi:hypothetical protein